MENIQFNIIPEQSQIEWKGRKVTGAHHGIINIKKGSLIFNNGKLTGGAFVIDIRSIKILDITDPVTNAQFAGHLASDDFFSSEKFPEALFVISSVEPTGENNYDVNGDLTIKGITDPVIFSATVNLQEDTATASGKIIVDRTRYGIKFRSGNFFQNLGDNLIYNDFDLNVHITAFAASTQPVTAMEGHY